VYCEYCDGECQFDHMKKSPIVLHHAGLASPEMQAVVLKLVRMKPDDLSGLPVRTYHPSEVLRGLMS